jgi:amino acid transporter
MSDSNAPENATNLRRTLGMWGVMGQSISGVAPTATPTINIALVFAMAGSGSWLAYVIATVAILLVASNLVPLAQKFAGAGSLSELVGHGLGDHARRLTAWSLLLAYLSVSVATLAGSAGYVSTLFAWAGLSMPVMGWAAIIGVFAVVFALRNIRFSTGLMLALEVTSVLLVVALGAVILMRQGVTADLSQFRLDGLSATGLSNALLIGVLSFVGFEAAATLGDEAKEPLVSIPRALILTPLLTGVFFVFSAYVIVLGFNRYAIPVASSSAPLDELARAMHLPGLGLLVSLGAAISLFACGIATIVASSRLLFALSRQGGMPPIFGDVTGRNSLPKAAVATTAGIILFSLLLLTGIAHPLDIYDWLGTFGTFGCVTAYALTCIAAPVFLRRSKQIKPRHVVVSALALLVLGYVLVGSIYPVPATPMNLIPWLFAVFLLISFGFSTWYARRSKALR